MEMRLLAYPRTVSYTHLDVYKRQRKEYTITFTVDKEEEASSLVAAAVVDAVIKHSPCLLYTSHLRLKRNPYPEVHPRSYCECP